MANLCPHGFDLDRENLPCPNVCQQPDCGHNCHWHYGQCCDAGGYNECEYCNTNQSGGVQTPKCDGWLEE